MSYDLEDTRGGMDWSGTDVVIPVFRSREQKDQLGSGGTDIVVSPSIYRSAYAWDDESPLARLTEKQSLVAVMLGAGMDPGEIANRLRVTRGTVDRHIRVLKRHWQVQSLSALICRLSRAQLMYERSRALYLFDEILPELVGARIEAPFLHEGEWCGLVMRLASGQVKKVWLMSDERGEQAGWLLID